MKFEIKFPELEQANEFAAKMKDKNLRGVKVSQAQKKAQDGALDIAEFLPWVSLAVSSPFVKTVAIKVIEYLQERMKVKTEEKMKTKKTKLKIKKQNLLKVLKWQE